ncbi:MAG: NADPH-dependent assimilatory sulfite reductase hemoprotein subunit [Acetobacteraceae bacterium]|nr:NADPH-dependent assimilatory sulfite reductase hemoprotein subunit [Acetobacteraceae bacterium]
MNEIRPLSANERIKSASNFLRGTIAEGLTIPETGAIADDDQQLTKFHGIYLQDDRDLRAERGRQRMEKAFIFMARMRVPSGVLTPAQYLAADKMARERGNATLRFTTRQTIQFHGIVKSNLRPLIQGLHAEMLDTIAACGDVNRNVCAAVVPWLRTGHAAVTKLAEDIANHLLPKSRAWHEIWIGEERVAGGVEEDEPIYGRTYMPRKFKIGVALPPHNDVDAFAQDLSFVAIEKRGKIVGYDVIAGGGMGMTHGEPETYPRAGSVIGFCKPEHAVEVAEKVVTMQRDHGDRSNRKQARLKYTIDRMGLDAFIAGVNERLSVKLEKAKGFTFASTGDRLGWAQDDTGLHHITLFVENGRIGGKAGDGLREIAALNVGRFIITANQNLALADIPAKQKSKIAALLKEYGLDGKPKGLRRNAVACVALPTCGLALAESERYLPSLVTKLEAELDAVGLAEDEITIRMTGCPNGCARPYMAEIGLVGRSPGLYNLYLGGAHDGTRLSKLHAIDVDDEAIVAALKPLFGAYATDRKKNESFGDFVIRAGIVARTVAGLDFHENLAPALTFWPEI